MIKIDLTEIKSKYYEIQHNNKIREAILNYFYGISDEISILFNENVSNKLISKYKENGWIVEETKVENKYLITLTFSNDCAINLFSQQLEYISARLAKSIILNMVDKDFYNEVIRKLIKNNFELYIKRSVIDDIEIKDIMSEFISRQLRWRAFILVLKNNGFKVEELLDIDSQNTKIHITYNG